MKGDNGICQQIFPGGKMVSKTKFDKIANCTANIEKLQSIQILADDVTSYKCKECNTYHSGSPEEHKLYGKKIKNKKS